MLEYDWDNSVGQWICSTSHALRKALGARLGAQGVTLRQWEVLAFLSRDGCGSQSELAEAMGIEPHTLAGVLSRMERDGLLARHSCKQDRRKNITEPTEKAHELWARAAVECREIRRRAVEGIPPADLEVFRRVCSQIHANLSLSTESLPVPVGEETSALESDTVVDDLERTFCNVAGASATTERT